MSSRDRRAVITGIGVVAPNGVGVETFWKSTREGMSVLDHITREGCGHLPLRIAGEVRGFDPEPFLGTFPAPAVSSPNGAGAFFFSFNVQPKRFKWQTRSAWASC